MYCFFFSSRRRHTRYWRDWSSDVCSSDLSAVGRAGLSLCFCQGPTLDARDLDKPTTMTTTTPIRTKRTGQRGSLWLPFEPKEEGTVLVGRYTGSPFGTVRANYPDGSGIPEVQITNPSGGILGGDSLELEISLAPGSPATILTRAANKAYRGASSEHRSLSRVGEGAFLEYLPHHLIPYSHSDCRQETTFHLAPDSTLITWDACAAGREIGRAS